METVETNGCSITYTDKMAFVLFPDQSTSKPFYTGRKGSALAQARAAVKQYHRQQVRRLSADKNNR